MMLMLQLPHKQHSHRPRECDNDEVGYEVTYGYAAMGPEWESGSHDANNESGSASVGPAQSDGTCCDSADSDHEKQDE